jgi:catechol 2,3-dioxygenase-like lactoylglutathione lyase family enzyme
MHVHIDRLLAEYERGHLTRRQLCLGLAAICCPAATAAPQPAAAPTFKATELNHIALRVAQIARSRAFYERHLGVSLMGEATQRSAFLRCGPHFVALFADRGPAGLDHFCFTLPEYEPGAAVRALESAGLAPQRREDRVYFKDPDGIELQVAAPRGAA